MYNCYEMNNVCDTKVNRFINIRKPFMMFLGIMIGILLSYNFFSFDYINKSKVVLIVISSVIGVLSIIFTICFILRKKVTNCFVSRIANNFINFICFFICFIVGFVITNINISGLVFKNINRRKKINLREI